MVQFKFTVFVLVAAAAAPVFALPIPGSNDDPSQPPNRRRPLGPRPPPTSTKSNVENLVTPGQAGSKPHAPFVPPHPPPDKQTVLVPHPNTPDQREKPRSQTAPQPSHDMPHKGSDTVRSSSAPPASQAPEMSSSHKPKLQDGKDHPENHSPNAGGPPVPRLPPKPPSLRKTLWGVPSPPPLPGNKLQDGKDHPENHSPDAGGPPVPRLPPKPPSLRKTLWGVPPPPPLPGNKAQSSIAGGSKPHAPSQPAKVSEGAPKWKGDPRQGLNPSGSTLASQGPTTVAPLKLYRTAPLKLQFITPPGHPPPDSLLLKPPTPPLPDFDKLLGVTFHQRPKALENNPQTITGSSIPRNQSPQPMSHWQSPTPPPSPPHPANLAKANTEKNKEDRK